MPEEIAPQPRERSAARTMLIAGLVAALVPLAMIGKAGGPRGVTAKPHTVEAGGFVFDYPKSWREMTRAELPATESGSVDGSVVAGLCPHGTRPASCSRGIDVTYMIFKQAEKFPNPIALEDVFDHSLPKRFAEFDKLGGKVVPAADGTRYLRYEFTYVSDEVTHREIVAAYRAGTEGVVVIATGPETSFADNRSRVVSMLDGARQSDA